MAETITFPGCDTPTAPLGVGCWAWGDKSTWGMGGYDAGLTEASIAEAWEASLAAGVTLFDTAEIYGKGESERIIGKLLRQDPTRRDSLVIASKFIPYPWRIPMRSVFRQSLEASLGRLGIDHIDLYQIHGPISFRSHAVLADALAQAVSDKLVRAVGVSNYSVNEMRAMHRELAKRDVPLASNQIEFSLLRRRPDSGGLIAECARLGVRPLAYSPIGQGRLTGKYSAQNPPPKGRNFSAHPMEQVDAVVAVARRVGEAHERTPSEVALRWLIKKGAVPIPGAKNAKQASDNAGALGWELTGDDMTALDGVALDGTNSALGRIWQHG
ncbi:MAG: aldo/keto reductase [Acidimicrobiia bacterium]